MNTSNTTYTVLRFKCMREDQLRALELHNGRQIPVRGANPEVEDGVRVLRLDGVTTLDAVETRVRKSGALKQKTGRVAAVEILLTFSPGPDLMPSPELFAERGERFLNETFGRDNVVAIWLHLDEKTPHLHALLVPICMSVAPGRPFDNEEVAEQVLAVSWHRYSGSDKRIYRDPAKAKKPIKAPRKSRARKLEKNHKNDLMVAWQTGWSKVWLDHGFKRGISSTREHLPMKYIHSRQDAIVGRAKEAIEAIQGTAATVVELPPEDLAILQQAPTSETVAKLVKTHYVSKFLAHVQPLLESGMTGIQLASERHARADLFKAYEALRRDYDALLEKISGGHPDYLELLTENGLLRAEVDRQHLALLNPDPEVLATQLSALTAAEIDRISASAKAVHAQGSQAEPAEGAQAHFELPAPKPKTKTQSDSVQPELPGFLS